ncbi:MAG TPA: NAD(P)-dependent alcohol dehydrogenase [Bacteroidales bacterium]|nr:NAD(P)-dependent alcohol dehydrogenase [Bacteroidales bacterium]
MKAVVLEKYGSPEFLKIKEVEKPVPGEDEVLIKVHAAALNDWDWQVICAKSLANRIMFGFFKPRINILGCDIAGHIEAVGPKVRKFRPGNEVYGDLCECGFGGFAEYVTAKENALAFKPAGMTFVQAAAIPQASMLAVQGLIDGLKIKPGQKLLINGAGGGVGTFGVQIAKLFNLEVTGVDCAEKLEMMRSMGFDQVIDYAKEDFTKNKKKYDLILDNKTSRSLFDYSRSLAKDGKYVTTGGNNGRLLQVVFFGWIVGRIKKKKFQLVILKPNKDLAYINELFETGRIKPVIDTEYPLEDLANAFHYFGAGHHKGKVVVRV